MTKSTKINLLLVLMSFIAAITLGGLIYAAIETDKFYWLAFVANIAVYFFIFRHLAKAEKAAEKAEEAAREKARKEGE